MGAPVSDGLSHAYIGSLDASLKDHAITFSRFHMIKEYILKNI